MNDMEKVYMSALKGCESLKNSGRPGPYGIYLPVAIQPMIDNQYHPASRDTLLDHLIAIPGVTEVLFEAHRINLEVRQIKPFPQPPEKVKPSVVITEVKRVVVFVIKSETNGITRLQAFCDAERDFKDCLESWKGAICIYDGPPMPGLPVGGYGWGKPQ